MDNSSENSFIWDPFEIQLNGRNCIDHFRDSNPMATSVRHLSGFENSALFNNFDELDCENSTTKVKGNSFDDGTAPLTSNDILFDDWDLAWQVPENICDWELSDLRLKEGTPLKSSDRSNSINSDNSPMPSNYTTKRAASTSAGRARQQPQTLQITTNLSASSRKRRSRSDSSDEPDTHTTNTHNEDWFESESPRRYHPLDNLQCDKEWTVIDYQKLILNRYNRIGKVFGCCHCTLHMNRQ